MTNNNEHYISFLIIILKNIIIRCNKKYLEESKIKIIPSDLMQNCIFSLTLDLFRQFQIKENDLGNLLPVVSISSEHLCYKKNLRIDKLKISLCFNVDNLLEEDNNYIVFKDSSKYYKSNISGVVDKIYTNIYNNDDYEMKKIIVDNVLLEFDMSECNFKDVKKLID